MNNKILLIIGVIAVVIVGGTLLFREETKAPGPSSDSSGLIVSKNAIYLTDQIPGENITVSVVHFETPGFVVVHEDLNDAPGKILGASSLLPAGETKNALPVTLSRTTKDGETLYAILHLDNGDGTFDAAKDKPAQDKVGGEPVMMIFTVSADAEEPGAVNL